MTSRGSSDTDDNVVDISEAKAKSNRATLDDILNSPDTPRMEIAVEEWGGKTLVIAGLTKKQQVDIREASRVGDSVDEALVSKGMFREGVVEPRFTAEQINTIWEKQAGVIDGILMTIVRLSGMDKEAQTRWERAFRSRR